MIIDLIYCIYIEKCPGLHFFCTCLSPRHYSTCEEIKECNRACLDRFAMHLQRSCEGSVSGSWLRREDILKMVDALETEMGRFLVLHQAKSMELGIEISILILLQSVKKQFTYFFQF